MHRNRNRIRIRIRILSLNRNLSHGATLRHLQRHRLPWA